jgi:RimJ/RimL family protein N-acetyltransferase
MARPDRWTGMTLLATSTVSEPAAVGGRWIELRPITPPDELRIAELVTAGVNGMHYRYRGATPGPDQLHHDLWSGVLTQFMICRRSSADPVGLVTAFNADLLQGHAHLGVCLDPSVQGRGWPFEAVGLFVEHLFQRFELRKLYAQMSDHNTGRVRSAIGNLLVEEARLHDHDFADGSHHDSVIYALWRQRWFDSTNRHRLLLMARSG